MVWELHPSNVGTGLPLEGVRVLDLSRVLAGPLCAMILGDLGADVVKVEGPEGDPVRALAPPRFGEDSTYYLAVNRHRRNVVADLRDPAQAATVTTLASLADVVIENFLPAQRVSLGIDALREAAPQAIWVSVTPATSGGPLAGDPSFDLLAQARSGLMGVTGTPESGPVKVGAPLADVVTGLYAAVGALSGLVARSRGVSARHFEAPLLESTMTALINQAQGFLSTGVAPRLTGNDHPSIAPYGPFATASGPLLLGVGTDAQWTRFVERVGDDRLREAAWSTNAARVADLPRLRAVLEQVLVARSAEDWAQVLAGSGVPVGPIFDVPGALSQPQVAQGDLVGEMEAPGGPTRALRSPLLIEGRRPPIRRGPRRLGEDTVELLGP